jgi:hypothetical protein
MIRWQDRKLHGFKGFPRHLRFNSVVSLHLFTSTTRRCVLYSFTIVHRPTTRKTLDAKKLDNQHNCAISGDQIKNVNGYQIFLFRRPLGEHWNFKLTPHPEIISNDYDQCVLYKYDNSHFVFVGGVSRAQARPIHPCEVSALISSTGTTLGRQQSTTNPTV